MRLLFIALTAQLSSAIISPAGADETCLAYARSEMNRLLEIARSCGGSLEVIESIQAPGLSDAPNEKTKCRQRAETLTEQDCPLVPICAALTLEYAIENINRFNGDCTSATEAGLRHIFVPE